MAAAKLRPMSPQGSRGVIVKRDPTVRVGRINRDRQGLK